MIGFCTYCKKFFPYEGRPSDKPPHGCAPEKAGKPIPAPEPFKPIWVQVPAPPTPTAAHCCHARGCSKPVRPIDLMCYRHWRLVPIELQRQVWATYRPGQCDDKRPSSEWTKAADAAIAAVAARERKSG